MTRQSVAVQGALALAGLVAAYFTWQRAPELATGEVVALDANKADVQKIRFSDDDAKSWVELTRGKVRDEQVVILRMSGFDASGVPLPAGHPGIEIKRPERTARGNAAAMRLFERFAPMRASRALGQIDATQLKDFGFDKTKKRIEITLKGGVRKYLIVPAPPGGSDPYVKDEADNRVYIVNRGILSDLQSASTNLVEKQLHPFFIEDITNLTVSQPGGKSRAFVATRNEDRMPGIRVAMAEKPDEPDQTARTWHDRIWNLFPSEVFGKDENPQSGAPVVALRIDYVSRGQPLGYLELARAAKPATPAVSTGAPPAASNEVFGRTEHTLGWVRLPNEAQTLLTEGEALLARK